MGDSSDSELEDDFPEIQLSEMLDELSLGSKESPQPGAGAAVAEPTHLYPRQQIQDSILDGVNFTGVADLE